jgi:NADP-dependent 3-hydroxy acid dehydrogenase YdfG
MKDLLRGKHAVVTGGARGIGRATVVRLVVEGVLVSLWDRDATAVTEAQHAISEEHPGAAIHPVVCDVTDAASREQAITASQEAFGPIDILVNNAGHLAPGNLEDQTATVWQTTIDVNFGAVVALIHAILPGMYERSAGHVVNISSASGAIGVPGLAVYSATKWAVWGLSEALRAEARTRGVRVSSVHPSYVAVGMFAGARLRGPGRFIVPQLASHDVVARAVVEAALKRGRAIVYRPRSVRLAVLFRGIFPDALFSWLMRVLGVWGSMSTWRGRDGREEISSP